MGIWSRYLVWIGLAIAIIGLVLLTALSSNILMAYGLLALGLSVFLVGIAFDKRAKRWFVMFLDRRSTRLGFDGLLSAIAIFAIWFFVNALAAQMTIRIDLTETRVHTLSSQTKETVTTLDKPLKIRIFQENEDAKVSAFLENYRRLNGRVQYDFIDPDIDVSLIRRFNVQNRGEVHLEYGDRTQFVQTLAVGESLTEAKLTNSIIRVTGDRQSHIYMLQGHGEPPLDDSQNGLVQMAKALEEQGYRVSPLNLIQTPALPVDADIIALVGPQNALLPGEVELLQQHLDQQKSLLVLLSPNTNPQIDTLLDSWGIKLDQRIIVDGDRRSEQLGYGNTTLLVTSYSNHPITENLEDNISLYQFVRPLSIQPREDITAESFLASDTLTWAETGLPSPDVTFDPSLDLRGPVDFGVALESQLNDKENLGNARLVVIGNTMLATNSGFNQYFNSDILLNSMNWLNQSRTVPLAIQPTDPQERRLLLTSSQMSLIGWLAPIICPLGGLVACLILIKKRR